MHTPANDHAPERVIDLDLDFEARAEREIGFGHQIVLEQAVFAELSALARTAPEKSKSHRGYRAYNSAGRPS